MENFRIAEILLNNASEGSGYLIAPQYVLTARHVVKPNAPAANLQVHFLREKGKEGILDRRPKPLAAQVVWASPDYDLALISLLDGPLNGITDALIPLAAVRRDGRPRQWRGSGFPSAAGRDQRTQDGLLTWVDTEPRHFDLDTNFPPANWREWAGFSGSSVFVGDHLVGIVRTVDPAWQGKLEATPVEYLLNDIGFLELIRKAPRKPPSFAPRGPLVKRASDFEKERIIRLSEK